MLHPVSAVTKILVVRTDRIGDVILSTPVVEVLKKHYPKAEITFMVREEVAPLMEGLSFIDRVMIYDPLKKHAGVSGFFDLITEIRQQDFKIAVVLQSEWRIAAALFAAGVSYRVGPLSKPHSFLFYNRGVRQRRSYVEMHETDYNLQLLRRLGIRVGTRKIPVRVHLAEETREKARKFLLEKGWQADIPLIAVHPGMGGSALNWPENHYVDLIRAVLKEGKQVLLTGGPSEGPLHERIAAALGPLKDKVMFYGGASVGKIDDLAGLLSWVDLVVAPSTGPLHLAVALGKPVVCFYPPIRVQSAIRWGPYLANDAQASVLVPEVYCGQDFKCLGNVCNYFPCMKTITVPQVVEQFQQQLARSAQAKISASDPEKDPKDG